MIFKYSALLLLGLLASGTQPALAKTRYVDADGKQHWSPAIAALLTSPRATLLNGSGANKGWHVCDRQLNYTNAITVEGEVNLILSDRCDMRVNGNGDKAGIRILGADSHLTIWAQSTDSARPSTKGRLTAQGGDRSAGIGGSSADGAVIINGGTIRATGGNLSMHSLGRGYYGRSADTLTNAGECCAGIGGVAVTIRGGAVNVTGGFGSAGIGGGALKIARPVTIYGGVVDATGGGQGAGIGGGYGSEGSTVTIYGGTVNATGGEHGAGIGGGGNGAGGAVSIYGGTVSASGGDRSAGIGIGDVSGRGYAHKLGGTIVIHGGKVIANGSRFGAGIGYGVRETAGGSVTIHGGTVVAKGGEHSAGIGFGSGLGADGSITITIDGGTVNAAGGIAGAGIGGSTGPDPIRITGSANVTAKGGDSDGVYGKGSAIGWHGTGGYTSGAGITPIQRPADAIVPAGGSATFGVTVKTAGTETANSSRPPYQWLESPDGGKSWPPSKQWSRPGIAYQWQQSIDDGKNWSSITGATKATLTLPRVTTGVHGNLYRCEVTISQQVSDYPRKSFIVYTTDFGRLEVK